MIGQKKLIYETDWDYLIILDACRYDYFKRNYNDFFSGDLNKVKSEGSRTAQWLQKTFEEKMKDVTYISSTPWINSKLPVKDEWEGEIDMRKKFQEIVDVWEFGWSNGTIPPKAVMESLRLMEEKRPEKRKIIHFKQPHAPYLSVLKPSFSEKIVSEFITVLDRLNPSQSEEDRTTKGNVPHGESREKIGEFIRNKFGDGFWFGLKDFLNMPARMPFEVLARKGKEELRRLYTENLRKVLETLVKILDFIEGKMVITSDHGEFLGEKFEDLNTRQKKELQRFASNSNNNIVSRDDKKLISGHGRVNHPILREVPWHKIEV